MKRLFVRTTVRVDDVAAEDHETIQRECIAENGPRIIRRALVVREAPCGQHRSYVSNFPRTY
jgi:hypothetical protein